MRSCYWVPLHMITPLCVFSSRWIEEPKTEIMKSTVPTVSHRSTARHSKLLGIAKYESPNAQMVSQKGSMCLNYIIYNKVIKPTGNFKCWFHICMPVLDLRHSPISESEKKVEIEVCMHIN